MHFQAFKYRFPLLLTLLTSILSSGTSAQVQEDKFDNEAAPTLTYSVYPPGLPTPTPEPRRRLDIGEKYANPKDNPFNYKENIIYGPTSTVKLLPATVTPIMPELDDSKQCEGGNGNGNGTRIEQKWANHLVEVLDKSGLVQKVGFSLDLFRKLEEEERVGKVLGELTVGRGIRYEREPVTKNPARRWVIGTDDRVEVTNTWIYPYNAVGQVGTGCTGTLIGPRHVLTAGHCVHSGAGGSWHSNLNFTLYKTPGGTTKYQKVTFDWSQVFSVEGWTKKGKWEYDYALIILDVADTKEAWVPFGYHNGLSSGWKLNLNGFPSDKAAESMWHSYGPVIDTSSLTFDHEIDLMTKESGSGIYLYTKSIEKRVIYGIQSTHSTACYPNFPDFWNCHKVQWNTATRINKARFKQICGWMNAGLC